MRDGAAGGGAVAAVEVVVFGREPVPGRVKTRLAATLGASRAAAVYACLLDHALAQASGSGLATVVAFAERPSPGWHPSVPADIVVQGPGDLGARMAACFADRFARGADVVVLVGSDVPLLRAGHLRAAAAACRSRVPVVLGPSADGGYWLVAQRSPGVDVFTGIPWSTSGVLAATRSRLTALGAGWEELVRLADVDVEADLVAALADPVLDPALAARLRRALAG